MYFFGYTREVPFFPLTAFYLVLLPSITRFYSQNNIKKAREIITKMFELILIIIAPIAVIIAASAENILTLFYKPSYGAASIALAFQIFGEFFVGIMVVLCMIISSTGKKKANINNFYLIIGCSYNARRYVNKNFRNKWCSFGLIIIWYYIISYFVHFCKQDIWQNL